MKILTKPNMTKILIVFWLGLMACQILQAQKKHFALYDYFEYEGIDSVYEQLAPTQDEYLNPILMGFYPDPSICRVDNDYYLVNSSFSFFPGIPIFHSTDLVHWEQLGYVMNRPSQLKLEGLKISYGIFAPTIRYHKGTFYVICTLVNGGGNFYVTAKNPQGPWSDPIWLDFDGIDPSFFFDDNGKAYIINNDAPEGQPLYSGHRAIWMQEFIVSSGKLSGLRKVIVNGGVDISKKPIWIEGPHIFKDHGYYYLIAAEGGTASDHSEVVFRSDSVWGPYLPGPINPILTQRNLNPNRPAPVTCTGHADFVLTQEGEWWSVFLGCQPYTDNLFNTGRETFLLPVKWKDHWPIITADQEVVPLLGKKPDFPTKAKFYVPNGNFSLRDDFTDTILAPYWNFIRTPKKLWYNLKQTPGHLRIDLQPISITDPGNPSFIGRRQQHSFFTISTALKFAPKDPSETAGLMAFQNEGHFIYLGVRKQGSKNLVFVQWASKGAPDGNAHIIESKALPEHMPSEIYLKIEGNGATCNFYYALKPDEWKTLKLGVDATNLSTTIAGGFVGTYLGMYASSNHEF